MSKSYKSLPKNLIPKYLIKSESEIAIMREGGKILAEVLQIVAEAVKPGITTKELDEIAEKEILKRGAKPSFKNYSYIGCESAYPASICISINDEVIHGIPRSDRVIKDGDIIGLDMGGKYKGYYTDMTETVMVGKCSEEAKKLVSVAKDCLTVGIAQAKVGNRMGDISEAIQNVAEGAGFSVVQAFVGHGVGKFVHEPPEVPNYGKAGQGLELKEGMTLALEPMVNMGREDVEILDDDWTVVTADGSLSAHFECTVLITKGNPEVLTCRRNLV
ncbi:type I methionyl aminopeptidase [bacterium]|nr:MAG: type I methionyl aminopeptidase [bacterium]